MKFDEHGHVIWTPRGLYDLAKTTPRRLVNGSLFLPCPFSCPFVSWRACFGAIYDSNSARGTPDCRMIERRVPILTSLWFGTGTVVVPAPVDFCITMWLPRCLTRTKPCRSRI